VDVAALLDLLVGGRHLLRELADRALGRADVVAVDADGLLEIGLLDLLDLFRAAFALRAMVIFSFGGGTGSGSVSTPLRMSFSMSRASASRMPVSAAAVCMDAPAARAAR
jgi:hypothetical protein